MAQDYFLGIDGGGTKTAAVLIDRKGHEIARAISGPSNFYTVGKAVAEASLREAIQRLRVTAGPATSQVAAIGLGMAGVDRPGDREVILDMLLRIGQFDHITIVNDSEAALVGGVGRRHGLVLIAGTGAIAYGVNAQGTAKRADGWGYVAGDEGSAHWIGVEGLRAVARAHDGRGPDTLLTKRLVSHLDIADVTGLVTLVYGEEFGVPQLAGLAPLVSQAARDGDPVAQAILNTAGELLGNTLGAVVRGLHMSDEAFEAVFMGGVLRAKDIVYETVLAALNTHAPRAQVIEPRHDAAVGAALLAQQTGV
jgi:N-acetylglucosamine kinase